jgi:hypothetical protein
MDVVVHCDAWSRALVAGSVPSAQLLAGTRFPHVLQLASLRTRADVVCAACAPCATARKPGTPSSAYQKRARQRGTRCAHKHPHARSGRPCPPRTRWTPRRWARRPRPNAGAARAAGSRCSASARSSCSRSRSSPPPARRTTSSPCRCTRRRRSPSAAACTPSRGTRAPHTASQRWC